MKKLLPALLIGFATQSLAMADCNLNFSGTYANSWGSRLQLIQRGCEEIDVIDLDNQIRYPVILDGKTRVAFPAKFLAQNTSRNRGIIKSGSYVAERVNFNHDPNQPGYVAAKITVEVQAVPGISVFVESDFTAQNIQDNTGKNFGITSGFEESGIRVVDIRGIPGSPSVKKNMIDGANIMLNLFNRRLVEDAIGMYLQSI